jgi:3-oxoacyl-[acyl-carrier protein] reductase
MREQGSGGRLILVASPAGQRGNFGQTNYAAAKAGIVAMARTWALELARSRITANAVVPVAATEMTKTIPVFAPVIEEAEETGNPLPEWLRKDEGFGTAEDAAGLVVFLASDAASEVTGQAIGIGGDKLALWTHPREKEPAAYRDGGWDADSIAGNWSNGVGSQPETYGIPAPIPRGEQQ